MIKTFTTKSKTRTSFNPFCSCRFGASLHGLSSSTSSSVFVFVWSCCCLGCFSIFFISFAENFSSGWMQITMAIAREVAFVACLGTEVDDVVPRVQDLDFSSLCSPSTSKH